jgi:hypothetical protein
MDKVKGHINSVSGPREFNGELQIGFTLKDNPSNWFNIKGDEEQLNEIKKLVIKGNEIEFDFDKAKRAVSNLKVLKEAEEKSWDEDIINFETLLSEAHKKGMKEIETECIDVNIENKYALFKAKVVGYLDKQKKETGIFTGHGDATDENVKGDYIRPHYIRMAETRAIARALRWYTNNASCTDVETSKTK